MPFETLRAFKKLVIPTNLEGTSDQVLASEIASTHYAMRNPKKNPKKPAVVLPSLGSKVITPVVELHGGFRTNPIAALHRLGIGTATPGKKTPLLESFTKLSQVLKYFDAFENDGNKLSLSAQVDSNTQYHSRSVLSEELGVGFGLLIGEQWCRSLNARGPLQIINIDQILGSHGIATRAGSRMQPDYAIRFDDPVRPGTVRFCSVECKGTKTESSMARQLARGCSQIDSLLLGNSPMPGLVTSTLATGQGISYKAVDPGVESPSLDIMDFDLDRARNRKVDIESIEGFTRVTNVPDFLTKAVALGNARLAITAGDRSSASRWWANVPEPEQLSEDLSTTTKTIYGQSFRGIENSIVIGEGRAKLTLFTGLATEVREALKYGTADAVHGQQVELQNHLQNLSEYEFGLHGGEAMAAANDGTISWISIKTL
ncbi:hypothetical protein ACTXJR_12285 [Glutamicibacter ardleyensis]|uniref:hypothetical protein n=1 Tax=Glutamicibacter ardleyensis TaxID=225894 RepID=UPI003FD3DA12